jgi:DNA ligase-1
MLGKPAKGIEAILERFAGSLFTIEFKYDGERAQIHLLSDGSVKIYSRNSEDNTGKYPDLVTDTLPAVKDERTVSAIIDTEVVAYDPESKKILPFQTLSTRKRKVVDQATIQVQVCLFAFDLLFHNGKSYLEEPFAVRREVLHSHFKPVEGKFQFAEFKDTNDPEDIQAFLTQSVAASCEGLMVKALTTDAGYIPAKRNWLKVKKDYLDGVGDTLDLVPIGAWHGKGKRKGVYGAYLLAIYDEESETYQSICKIGTGFSDEDLESRAKSLSEFEIDAPPRYYQFPEAMACDVYFSPAQVWEVLCADLSISPVHCAAAGLVHESKGIALRFPRFVRLREDKKPEEATSAAQVVDFYQNQSVRT